MVPSTLLSIALSYGLLGLQVLATPIVNLDQIPPLKAIREDDLLAGTVPLNKLHSRSIADSMKNAIQLMPIDEDEFLPSHLRKRSDDLARLDLQDQVKLIYGGVVSDKQIYLANMTLHQPDPSHPLIMMEKFDKLLRSISCRKGRVVLRFNDEDAMNYAIKAWDWINEKESDYFFLIANHKSCSENMQRTPYRVDKVKYDKKSFTTTLTTNDIPWETVATDFDLSISSANMPRRVRTRSVQTLDIIKRGFWDFIGNFNFGKSVYWDLTIGDVNGGRRKIFADPLHEFSKLEITCVGCYLAGGVEIGGFIKVEKGSVKQLYVAAKPKNLHGKLEVETFIRASLPEPGLKWDVNLFELGIPGLSIPGIFTLGPSLQYQVGFQLAAAGGQGNFSLGVQTTIPNEATVIGNLLDVTKSSATGFEGSTVKPILMLNEMSARANFYVYAQPVIGFGVRVLTQYGVEGAIELKLPYINADIVSGYNKDGFCPNDKLRRVSGAKSTSGANIELWFKAAKFTGFPSILSDFDRKLWGVRWPFYETCFPMQGSPGFRPPEPVYPTAAATTIDPPITVTRSSDGSPTFNPRAIQDPPPFTVTRSIGIGSGPTPKPQVMRHPRARRAIA
ncbi:hypothetical protein Dda_5786 [Drechslerella dactyloides]|uniref:Uncharacterized protein n=1 Tax=Drechslerella dactyloides TaxID=74499 RepID=A0AAD6IUY2_DREDA|nr:hypothetical protein Dda_5786 [Drechslerella dactyloides]